MALAAERIDEEAWSSRRELRRAKRLIRQATALNWEMVGHVEARAALEAALGDLARERVVRELDIGKLIAESQLDRARIERDKAEVALRTKEFHREAAAIDALDGAIPRGREDGTQGRQGKDREQADAADVIAQKRGVLEALRRAGWADTDPVVAVVREMFNQRLARMTD